MDNIKLKVSFRDTMNQKYLKDFNTYLLTQRHIDTEKSNIS